MSTFGIGKDVEESAWRAVFRQLVALGFLVSDSESRCSLLLTESSRTVLKSQQKVLLRQQTEFQQSSRQQPTDSTFSLDPVATALWARLRAWRVDIARMHGVPAYVVFHDATLKELVRICPQTEDELRMVSGVGANKLEKYGEDLIAIFRDN